MGRTYAGRELLPSIAVKCPTCNREFVSRYGKKFCTLDCYRSSELWAQNKLKAAESRRKAGIENICVVCGKKMTVRSHSLKFRHQGFCSAVCRRSHWNKLFDAMIDSPEGIPLPQNYDEFLDREELQCILPGCDWKGQHLSLHLRHFHGIAAEKFKEAASFNRHTALISKTLAKKYSDCANKRIDDMTEDDKSERLEKLLATRPENCSPQLRNEGREHMKKAIALKDGQPRNYGDGKPGHKLSVDQVRTIKRMLKESVATRDIATMFDVSRGSIEAIANGRTWKWVAEEIHV